LPAGAWKPVSGPRPPWCGWGLPGYRHNPSGPRCSRARPERLAEPGAPPHFPPPMANHQGWDKAPRPIPGLAASLTGTYFGFLKRCAHVTLPSGSGAGSVSFDDSNDAVLLILGGYYRHWTIRPGPGAVPSCAVAPKTPQVKRLIYNPF
jgi:hypothetical protein